MLRPPVATRKDKALPSHGITRIDPYYWLNERDNPDVVAYLEAENAFTKASLAHTEPLQESLFEEMKGRIKEADQSVPYFWNGFHYYRRFEEGKEHPVYCRRQGTMEAAEQVMLDVNGLAAGQEYCRVLGMAVSPDNRWLAFTVDAVGRNLADLRLKNLETGAILPYHIGNVASLAWANDGESLFYGTKDGQTLREDRILRHILNKPGEDQSVFFENDDTFYTSVHRSKSGKYLFVYSYGMTRSETRFIEADQPDAAFRVICPRRSDHLYQVEHRGDFFYVLSNAGATNFKLLRTRTDDFEETSWEEIVPHRADVLLEGMELFRSHLVLQERKNGLVRLRVLDEAASSEQYVSFYEPTYLAALGANPEFETTKLRYVYESLTTPSSTFDYDMAAQTSKLLKQREVLGGFDRNDYASERIWATAGDGTSVPISLVYRKGLSRNGSRPAFLTGYGSYGISYDVHFSSARLSLLDRGFVFAIAHIRGGQEMGRQWYEDGKLFKKMNTFTDFIACAEFLISEGYTSSDRLFAEGGSAGGLLMGAVVNMRPDLFAGIVAAVPFVDVMTTMLDDTIPLTTVEYDEWGNPNERGFYDYMIRYSPYDNVKAQNYPAMLVTTAFMDSQVQYWEPAKWVAKLRATKTDAKPLYLHTEMAASHAGKSGRFEALKLTALEYAFVLEEWGKATKEEHH